MMGARITRWVAGATAIAGILCSTVGAQAAPESLPGTTQFYAPGFEVPATPPEA